MALSGAFYWEAWCSNNIARKQYETHMFKNARFRDLSSLAALWKPSWLILGVSGPQNGGHKLIQKAVQFLVTSWTSFGAIFGVFLWVTIGEKRERKTTKNGDRSHQLAGVQWLPERQTYQISCPAVGNVLSKEGRDLAKSRTRLPFKEMHECSIPPRWPTRLFLQALQIDPRPTDQLRTRTAREAAVRRPREGRPSRPTHVQRFVSKGRSLRTTELWAKIRIA